MRVVRYFELLFARVLSSLQEPGFAGVMSCGEGVFDTFFFLFFFFSMIMNDTSAGQESLAHSSLVLQNDSTQCPARFLHHVLPIPSPLQAEIPSHAQPAYNTRDRSHYRVLAFFYISA